MKQTTHNVGLYARLSRDDNNGNSESMSIANQKQILSKFAEEQGWRIVDFYIDDGYTGTNFDRPDFKRMLRDIENTRIDCVITKDLSRLGRNYSMTGYYTDEYFPEHNVRYIAINDGVDTKGNNNDFAAFHNVINEYYPKEISKKVRQVKRTNAEKGMFMGSRAPYGYKKSPLDKHQLIIDDEVSPIVVRIFKEMASGKSGRWIAEQLNQEGFLCPRAYYYRNIGKDNPKNESMLWGSSSILGIITSRVYLGTLIQGQRQVVSFKSKKRRLTEPEEWIIVENAHEAIIDSDLWDAANNAKKGGQHYNLPKTDRDISVFAGLVRCADCGSPMCASLRGRTGLKKLTYRCSRYTNYGKEVCRAHNVREEVLEAVVLNDIHSYARLAQSEKQDLVQRIATALRGDTQTKSEVVAKQLQKAITRKDEINKTVKNLYSEKISGKMPESFFYSLLNDYEKELATVQEQIETFSKQITSEKNIDKNADKFVRMAEKYLKIEHLDFTLAHELIESITVSEFYFVDGNRTQDITIQYKFVGDLSVLLGKNKDAA